MQKIGKFCLILIQLVALKAFAETKVQATVDSNTIELGQDLTFTITISSPKDVDMEEPQLPDLTDWQLINRWQGSQVQSSFVNGQFTMSRQRNFNYNLQPAKTGKLTLGEATVMADGAVYKTKAITVTVVNPGQLQGQRGGGNQGFQDPFENEDGSDPTEEIFNQLLRRRLDPSAGMQTKPMDMQQAFSIELELDRKEAYVGEQVVASWWLYTRGNLHEFDALKYPALAGFWKEDIEVPTRFNFETEIINGVPYRKALLVKYALFPIKEGKTTIDEFKAKCKVSMGGLGGFGFGTPYVYTKSSRSVPFNVKKLPVEGRPKDFTGAVGKFEMSAKVEQQKIKVGEPFSLLLRLEGFGNAKLIDLPALNLPSHLEEYDVRKDAKFFKTGSSYKEFEIYLIPRQEGEVEIPSFSISVFDPDLGKFVQKETKPIKIQVQKGEAGANISAQPMATNSAPQLAQSENAFPGLALSWQGGENMKEEVRWSLRLTGLLLVLFYVLFFAYKNLANFNSQQDLIKSLRQRLAGVQQLLEKNQHKECGRELMNAVYLALGVVSEEGGAHLELDKLLQQAPPSVRESLGADFLKEVEIFQTLAFAPEALTASLKDNKKLKKNIQSIESTLIKALKVAEKETVDASANHLA